MAYTDPQTVTVNAVAKVLNRTGSGIDQGVLTATDGNNSLKVSHQYGKRTRRAIRFTSRKIAADPLVSAVSVQYSMGITVVFDLPPTGYTAAEALLEWNGFATWLTAASAAKVTQLLGGES
jgi:hypothetical protein